MAETEGQLILNRPVSDYVHWKPIDRAHAYYKNKLTGQVYIGHLTNLYDNEEDRRTFALMVNGAGDAAANVLNHENLVSVHTEILEQHWVLDKDADGGEPVLSDPHRLILYDYCDAGTLKTLLERPPVARGVRGPLMPESLCWHVAISLIRALQWLHEGIRDIYNVAEDKQSRVWWTTQTRCVRVRVRSEPQVGWLPILHRDIRAENVMLSHPKGIETYGTVKLGGFRKCVVTGGILHGDGVGKEDAVALAWEKKWDAWKDEILDPGIVRMREGYGRWKQEGRAAEEIFRPYTTGSDLRAVGAVLYEMMFGWPPPAPDECVAMGCNACHWYRKSEEPQGVAHVQSNPGCMADLDLDSFPDHLNYTSGLKKLLKTLMGLEHKIAPLASTVMDDAWLGYQKWATSSAPAARAYRDVYDDIWMRRQNEWRMQRRQEKGLVAPISTNVGSMEALDPDVKVI